MLLECENEEIELINKGLLFMTHQQAFLIVIEIGLII